MARQRRAGLCSWSAVVVVVVGAVPLVAVARKRNASDPPPLPLQRLTASVLRLPRRCVALDVRVWSGVCACQRCARVARHSTTQHDTTFVLALALICLSLSSCVCRLVLSALFFGVPGRAATSSSSSSGGSCQGGAWLWIGLQANADADDACEGGSCVLGGGYLSLLFVD